MVFFIISFAKVISKRLIHAKIQGKSAKKMNKLKKTKGFNTISLVNTSFFLYMDQKIICELSKKTKKNICLNSQ